MAPLSLRATPRHLVSTRRAPPSSPPRLVRVRNPQRLPRTDAGPAVRRRPAPAADPPGCVGGVRRWRPRFPLTGSGCMFLYRETKRKAGPQPSPPGPILYPIVYMFTTGHNDQKHITDQIQTTPECSTHSRRRPPRLQASANRRTGTLRLRVRAQSHMLTCIAVLTCGHTRAHTPHKRAQC
jgi:hypothetical protein